MKIYRRYFGTIVINGEIKTIEFPASHNLEALEIMKLWMLKHNYISEFDPTLTYTEYLQVG